MKLAPLQVGCLTRWTWVILSDLNHSVIMLIPWIHLIWTELLFCGWSGSFGIWHWRKWSQPLTVVLCTLNKYTCFGKSTLVKLLKILWKCHVRETLWLFIIKKIFIVCLATQLTQSSLNKEATLLKAYVNLVTFPFLLTLLQFLSYHPALCSHGYRYLTDKFPSSKRRKSATFEYSEMK